MLSISIFSLFNMQILEKRKQITKSRCLEGLIEDIFSGVSDHL